MVILSSMICNAVCSLAQLMGVKEEYEGELSAMARYEEESNHINLAQISYRNVWTPELRVL